jgi:hypothetical protein
MKGFERSQLCELQHRVVKIHYAQDGTPMATICQSSLARADNPCSVVGCSYHGIFQEAALSTFVAKYGDRPVPELVSRGLMFESGPDFRVMGAKFIQDEMGGTNLVLREAPKKAWWRFGR